jgi:hypothetical protein
MNSPDREDGPARRNHSPLTAYLQLGRQGNMRQRTATTDAMEPDVDTAAGKEPDEDPPAAPDE